VVHTKASDTQRAADSCLKFQAPNQSAPDHRLKGRADIKGIQAQAKKRCAIAGLAGNQPEDHAALTL
jgi:hypothetical protein